MTSRKLDGADDSGSSQNIAPPLVAPVSSSSCSSPRRGRLLRVLFFYDLYAFTNEELWYGVQWKDLTVSEMKLEELQQHDEHQALLDAYRKPSIPWRESHGYSIHNGRLRFDATTAKHLTDVRRRRAKRPRRAVPAAASASRSNSPMDLSSDSEGYSSVAVDDYVPLSYLVRFLPPPGSSVKPVAAEAESDDAADNDAPLSTFVR
jgi:hypothetical protein